MDIREVIQGKRIIKRTLWRVIYGKGKGQTAPDPSPPSPLHIMDNHWDLALWKIPEFLLSNGLSLKTLLDTRSKDHKEAIQVKRNGHPPFCFSPETGSGSLSDLLEFDCCSGEQFTLNKMAFATENKSFPGVSDGKESAYNAGSLGSIPKSERSPGEGNGNLLQYSCLENPMDRDAWWATVRGITVRRDWSD